MDRPITPLSQLKKRIEEIKKMDPKLQYTAEQLERRRNQRINKELAFVNLLPTTPLALAAPDTTSSTHGYRFNTEFYRNSIALRRNETLQRHQQPLRDERLQGDQQPQKKQLTSDSNKISGSQQQEPRKAVENNVQKLPQDQANLNEPSSANKGIFMQLNPVLPEKDRQLPIVSSPIERQAQKKPEKNLFESSIPVNEQLGLKVPQSKTILESKAIKPAESLFREPFPKQLQSSINNNQSSLSGSDKPSLFASNLSNLSGAIFTTITNQKPSVMQVGLFSSSDQLSKASTLPLVDNKDDRSKQESSNQVISRMPKLFQNSQLGNKKENFSKTSKPDTQLRPNPFVLTLSQPQPLTFEPVQCSEHKKETSRQQPTQKKIIQKIQETIIQTQEDKQQSSKKSSLFPQGEQSLSPTKKKPEMAIGPGGKGFELMDSNNFFSGDGRSKSAGTNLTFGNPPEPTAQETRSTGLFGNQTSTTALFGQSYFSKAAAPGGLFGSQSKPSILGSGSAPNIFGDTPKTGFFGENNSNQGPSIFGQGMNGQGGLFSQGGIKQGNSLFGQIGASQSSSLFGQGGSGSLFGQGNKGSQLQEKEDEQDGQDDESGPVEAEQEIDPSKSTGNYDYVKSNIIFKDTAVKFREGSKQTLQNVMISIETFPGGNSTHLFVRLANKCIALSGQLVPGTTQIRVLNNNTKNIEIKMILCQNNQGPKFVMVKIQLKDESAGSKLLEAVEKILKNE